MNFTFSTRLRVWTGARETPLELVIGADATEIDEVRSRLFLRLAPSSADVVGGGVFLARAEAPSSRPRVFLASERFRILAVYSPSPFSSSVLLVIDVGDSQQQCYFFDDTRRCEAELSARAACAPGSGSDDTRGQEENEGESWDLNRGVEAATLLLAELHSSFPHVPLVPTARELLASAVLRSSSDNETWPIAPHSERPGVKAVLKRRRTLSAANFYGKQTPATPIAKRSPARPEADGAAWRAFYERLQFRVSRSQLCQLQGSADVSSVFPRQQEAFEFADQIASFRQRVRENSSTLGGGDYGNGDSDSRFPRVFSFEDAREGRRRFLVSSFAGFWDNYAHHTLPTQRHVYEIIREGVPCRLYFDLEFKKSCNSGVNGDQLVARLVSLVQLQLFRKYRIHARREDVIQLDSSTSAKFSRHLIGELFVDNIHAGNFVRELIHDLVENSSEAEDDASPFVVDAGRQRQQQPTEHDNSDHAPPQRQLFIDTGVYTRNRMFRVLGSSKFRRDAVLRVLSPASSASSSAAPAAATARTSGLLDRKAFLDALVCPFPTLHALHVSPDLPRLRLLKCDQSDSALKHRSGARPLWAPPTPGNGSSRARLSSAHAVESRESVFPKIDAFILTNARHGGVQGEIRAVQMLFDNVAAILPGDPAPPAAASSIEPVIEKKPTPWMLIYHMARNRWCWNVHRAHKSNNVMFVVDLGQRVFYQKCHDQSCKAVDYRSPPLPLPPDLIDA